MGGAVGEGVGGAVGVGVGGAGGVGVGDAVEVDLTTPRNPSGYLPEYTHARPPPQQMVNGGR